MLNFRCDLNSVSLNDQVVTRLNVNTFLGLSIDGSLKFEDHILKLCKRISSGCYALRIIANNLDNSIARSSYFALIESHLRYGISFWGSCTQYLFNSLFVLQKRALRYLCGARVQDSCRPLFVGQGILTLCGVYVLEIACLVRKKYRAELTTHSVHNTRQSFLLDLPIPKTEQVKKSLIYGGKKIFNHLPVDIRKQRCDKKFKRLTKEFLTEKAYYTLDEFFNDVNVNT